MALEPCPHCRKQFDHDNAGARANHVEACAKEAAKYQQGQQQDHQAQTPPSAAADPRPPAQAAQPQQGQQPAQQPQGQPQGQGLPAIAEQQSAEVGMALGQSIISPWMSDDPTEQQVGKARGMKTIAGMLFSAAEEKEQEAKKGRQRARQRAGEELQPTEQLPVCAECGSQIHNMPESGTFTCPGCGIILQA